MATPAPSLTRLEHEIDVETPEQVVVSYTVAGLGSRAVAALVDFVLVAVAIAAFWSGVDVVRELFPGRSGLPAAARSWAIALAILLSFAVVWGYFVLFEALADGQTPGKKWLGLRVVQDGGYSVSFASSAVRNLARAIDMQPFLFYGVGIVSVAISRSGKRLGDMLAGTFVVRERVISVPAAELANEAGNAGVSAQASLTDEEYALLERFLARASALAPARRAGIQEELLRRFASHLDPRREEPIARLRDLYVRERAARARGASGRGGRGAARERHAIVALGVPRWTEFARRLTHAQQIGLRAMDETEVGELVARYRELAADLARLRTASRGQQSDALFYLSRLVAGGHNLLYRQRQRALQSASRYVMVTIPREIRRSAAPIGLAALAFFGPMVVTHWAVVHSPSLASDLLPAGMIDRAETGVERARTGRGYIDDPQLMRPVMGSTIIANNVQIAFFAFAAGLTAGLGTLFVLITNGLAIGAVTGLYQSKGILSQLVAFVAPHGVLELSAIAIAGGGGLLIASAILLPGDRTRREALVIRGRRALHLIVGAALLLLVAGMIEGFISPIESWPLQWKLAVSAFTALMLAAYLSLGRRAADTVPAEQFAYRDDPFRGSLAP